MNPKIIYLCYLPLLQKREEDHYLNELIQAGISIEYWDLSNIFFPDIDFVWEVKGDYIKKIHDYTELEEMILAQDIKKCFFIVMITFSGKVIKLHRILTKYKCYLIFFARSGLPAFSANESLLRKVVKNSRNYLRIDKLKQKYLTEIAMIYKRIGLIKNYDLVFAAGSVEESRYNGISKIIPINHFDYDNYLGLKDNPEQIINNEYCVFLDDNLVYDTDFKINNIKTIKPIPYFKSLCNFFDWVEKKYNLKVVIAAHPKAEYQGNEFGDRLIINDKTNELVKNCHFTIAHYSTSISYAILYNKPIIFIHTKEMKDMFYFQTIKYFANVLNANIYNINENPSEHNINEIKISNIDYSKYEDYKYKYLTSKLSENELSCNVFLQLMNKLINSL